MRGLIVIVFVAMISLVPVAVCLGNGEEVPVEPAGEEAVVEEEVAAEVEPDPFADWFAQLNLRSGIMWNAETEEWTGFATIPIMGYKMLAVEGGLEINPNEDAGPAAGVLGLTYRLGDLKEWGVGVAWAEHIGVNVGPVVRHSFETGENELAFLISFIDLSLDDGNVDRQRAD